jgi:hypothetical protein
MKKLRVTLWLIPLVLCTLHAPLSFSNGGQRSAARILDHQGTGDTVSLHINRIRMILNNTGSLDLGTGGGGGQWFDSPASWNNVIVYDHGIWVLGKVNGEVRAGVAQWGTSYSPGPIINGRPAMQVQPQDAPRYRVYKITAGDNSETNPDYANWPADLGAPVDGDGKPRISGDQMVWCVYNAADSTRIPHSFSNGVPFPRLAVEVQQSAFERAGTDCDSVALLANAVFYEWTIINKEATSVDSVYLSLWTDIDFGDTQANVPAIDTVAQLGYCWHGIFTSTSLPARPPAVGYTLLYGPIVPSPSDTGVFKGRNVPGVRNLPIGSFWGILDDSVPDTFSLGPAYSMKTAWNIARGLDKLGRPIRDPQTNEITKFPYSGDPVTGQGWVYSLPFHGGGSGFNLFCGPFTMAAGDTQWIMAALLPARGDDRFGSIQLLRQRALALRSMPYDSILQGSYPHIQCEVKTLPTTTVLLQNYPNPFNAGTVIEYTIGEKTHSLLQVFDILGRLVATLVDADKAQGNYKVNYKPVNLATGVYVYRLQTASAVLTNRFLLLK